MGPIQVLLQNFLYIMLQVVFIILKQVFCAQPICTQLFVMVSPMHKIELKFETVICFSIGSS